MSSLMVVNEGDSSVRSGIFVARCVSAGRSGQGKGASSVGAAYLAKMPLLRSYDKTIQTHSQGFRPGLQIFRP
jgi:hypothetical protein